jgi:hypothetical protein
MLLAISFAFLIVTAALTLTLRFSDVAEAHSTNPYHVDVIIGPGRSDTVTSEPFDSTPYVNGGVESGTPGTLSASYDEDDCGSTHGIDNCHHHISSASEWSLDIDSDPTSNDDVYFSVVDDPNYITITNYVFDITNLCSGSDPAGKTVWVEVWGRLVSDGIWRPLGIVTYGHVTPTVVDEGWYWPGEKIGDALLYTTYTGCYDGAHVHMDAYNYVHLSQWTSYTKNGASVTYSSTYSSATPLGFLGGSNDSSGADSHGGRWVGW